MENTADLLTALDQSPLYRGAGFPRHDTWTGSHEVAATLPNGRPVVRRCTRDYSYLVAVVHEGEWFPFRWVTTKRNLSDATDAAREAGYHEIETLDVTKKEESA